RRDCGSHVRGRSGSNRCRGVSALAKHYILSVSGKGADPAGSPPYLETVRKAQHLMASWTKAVGDAQFEFVLSFHKRTHSRLATCEMAGIE
ncbi:hypothetical protein, partial [Litorimonas sp.]|uniref:hypothetical protein n=1 Tax=Litorimonas sp. TaxID=1892381 RepID=UPI003A859BC7